MASLDLKPLNKETIQKMGYTNHDLWIVKVAEEVYGPFETQSLKHYASENEDLFEEALASRLDHTDWHPFFTHALFQRRNLQSAAAANVADEGPFWILINGQKSSPLHKKDLQEKLDAGDYYYTDLLSTDGGHSWIKVYEVQCFDRRTHTAEDLPAAPQEKSFDDAKFHLVEKLQANEETHGSTQDSLASLAHLGQKKESTIILNLDELTLQSLKETEISRSLKWAVPAMMAVVIAIAFAGYWILTPNQEENVYVEESTPRKKLLPRPPQQVAQPTKPQQAARPIARPVPQIARPQRPEMPIRHPASVRPIERHHQSAVTRPIVHEQPHEPRQVEPHIETHARDSYRDPEPANDGGYYHDREPQVQEHSLVNNTQQEQQPRTLDDQMNTGYGNPDMPLTEVPMVEEASDF